MNTLELLKNVGIFSGLDEKTLKEIAQFATERTFESGEYLMKQGESGIGLFMIASGKVRVEKKDSSGKVVETASNGTGDVLGEMSVLDGAERTASVIAEGPVKAYAIASWEFKAFLKKRPEIAAEILPVLMKRFRETNAALLGL
jgi:CRP-like cAMP-binding protein